MKKPHVSGRGGASGPRGMKMSGGLPMPGGAPSSAGSEAMSPSDQMSMPAPMPSASGPIGGGMGAGQAEPNDLGNGQSQAFARGGRVGKGMRIR